jgi:hypothetical protein
VLPIDSSVADVHARIVATLTRNNDWSSRLLDRGDGTQVRLCPVDNKRVGIRARA